jgi:hypothetical protein
MQALPVRIEYRGYLLLVSGYGSGWKVDINPPAGGMSHTLSGAEQRPLIAEAERYIDRVIDE